MAIPFPAAEELLRENRGHHGGSVEEGVMVMSNSQQETTTPPVPVPVKVLIQVSSLNNREDKPRGKSSFLGEGVRGKNPS